MHVRSFVPPRCPRTSCRNHLQPRVEFFARHGSYRVLCRNHAIPRYRCKDCHKRFSYQTFRQDYRDQRPDLNPILFERSTGGQSLRRICKELRLDIHAGQKKARKLSRHAGHLHGNLLRSLPAGRTFLMDELETHEGQSIRTVTVPILIEKQSGLVVATDVGAIRRMARKGSRRRRLQERDEAVHGKRIDESRHCVHGVLRTLSQLLRGQRASLRTDEKQLYASLCRKLFGPEFVHERTSSRTERDTFNPLFHINHTLARFRDLSARLHRRSWCASKKREFLRLHLQMVTVYRNYVCRRTNTEAGHRTPAWHLGLLPRALDYREVCSWRQDWGAVSPHPLSLNGLETVAA
ncbi:MAG: hypothetical protein RIT25_2920 [Planctomycetota bacterium]